MKKLAILLLMPALGGCIAGVLIAQWGGATLRLLVLPPGIDAGVVNDSRTLGLAAACAMAIGLFTAIAPALLALRGDLATTLRAGMRSECGPCSWFSKARSRSPCW